MTGQNTQLQDSDFSQKYSGLDQVETHSGRPWATQQGAGWVNFHCWDSREEGNHTSGIVTDDKCDEYN